MYPAAGYVCGRGIYETHIKHFVVFNLAHLLTRRHTFASWNVTNHIFMSQTISLSLRISQGPILVYFCCFPITSELIFCIIISSLTSMDSPPERFPFAYIFSHCFLFWNCLHSTMLKGTMGFLLKVLKRA